MPVPASYALYTFREANTLADIQWVYDVEAYVNGWRFVTLSFRRVWEPSVGRWVDRYLLVMGKG